MAIDLTVNGEEVQVTSSPDTPLLYVLRDEIGLRGPKFGCGLEECGACTVLTDLGARRSCVQAVSTFAGQHITTVEGLPALWAEEQHVPHAEERRVPDRVLHPVQQAWIAQQVPQCGYCQDGMMMTAVDLLNTNPSPSVSDIIAAYTTAPPSPHLCRCGTYDWIIKAVQQAAELMAAADDGSGR
jgi:aerobic-type carbon monoxide dehydrogenase small subunit (CoxS/CutS family)